MLAAFAYATRELKASQPERICSSGRIAQITSSTFPVAIPTSRQSGSWLHKKGYQREHITSPQHLGCNCKNQPSVYHGLEIKVDISRSKFLQNMKQVILASYGRGSCPDKF